MYVADFIAGFQIRKNASRKAFGELEMWHYLYVVHALLQADWEFKRLKHLWPLFVFSDR
jgi:hypothetical protein